MSIQNEERSTKLSFFLCWWRPILAVLIPVLLGAGIFGFWDTGILGRCGFVVGLMALYWVTEVIPLPVTGLIPMALFPFLGRSIRNNFLKFYYVQ